MIAVLALLLGCDDAPVAMLDTSPARVKVTWPAGSLIDRAPFALNPQVQTAAGRTLFDQTSMVEITTVPEGVLEVKGTSVTCLKTGDAVVAVRGGGKEEREALKCRLVEKIVAPKALQLLVGEAGTLVEARALGADGKELDNVTFHLQSADPRIADAQIRLAVGLAVGTTTLTVSAGSASVPVQLTVIERVEGRELTLNDGEALSYELAHGKYRIELDMRPSRQAISITDRGRNCSSPAAVSHDYRCSTPASTTLLIENPRDPGRPPAHGAFNLYRIP